jgi:hypothetical protein
VRVRRIEGVAIHDGPEPCVGVREGEGEASVGECIGQPLSRERLILGADTVTYVEGKNGRARDRECLDGPAWSENPACAEAPCTGPGDLGANRRRSCAGVTHSRACSN